MVEKGKSGADDAARVERARQLREQIKGSDRGKRDRTPRELTDEAAAEEYRKEKGRPAGTDSQDG